jgi:hypothetical protein
MDLLLSSVQFLFAKKSDRNEMIFLLQFWVIWLLQNVGGVKAFDF